MKPLLVSLLSRPTHPTRDGLAIRNFHLLSALAEPFRVRAFVLRAPHLDNGEYPRGIEVEEVAQMGRGPRRVTAAALSLVSTLPYSARLYRSAALERKVRDAVARDRPAWLVAHSYHLGSLAVSAGAPSWIDFHNLDSEIWSRTAETASSPAVRLFAGREAPRVRALETDLLERAVGTSCVSQRDSAAMRRLSAKAFPVVVPNGVDLLRYAFRAEPSFEKRVFFVGDLSWPPNAEAVRWFQSVVWPAVKRLQPDAVAEILGREPPADLLGRAGSDFQILGERSDTRPFWIHAAVAVVPLRAGGGTRLKILEAAACGVPVVATSLSVEGLELEPRTEILIRDDPREFADAVAWLLGDPEARRRQAAAARRRVETMYGWDAIGRRFAEELARRGAA